MNAIPDHQRWFVYVNVHDIEQGATSHGTGSKQILCPAFPEAVQLKQIAMGSLMPGETIALHAHADMDEYYYFLEGEGSMLVQGKEYFLYKGIFMVVPAGAEHSLRCSTVALQFFYFGLAVL